MDETLSIVERVSAVADNIGFGALALICLVVAGNAIRIMYRDAQQRERELVDAVREITLAIKELRHWLAERLK